MTKFGFIFITQATSQTKCTQFILCSRLFPAYQARLQHTGRVINRADLITYKELTLAQMEKQTAEIVHVNQS